MNLEIAKSERPLSPAHGSRSPLGPIHPAVLASVLVVLHVTAAQAQEASAATADSQVDPSSQRLQEVVVTGTRTELLVTQSPADVSVVTASDLQDQSIQRFDEALKGLPGVNVQSMGDGQPNNDVNIGMRGLPFTLRTGVYVDGQSINDAEYAAVDTSMIPVADIRQIEVAPGPFSALYGGSAMAGVINIITQDPDKREVKLAASYGSNATQHDTAIFRDRWQFDGLGIGLSLTGDYSQSQGYPNNLVSVPLGYFAAGTCAGCVTVTGGANSSSPEGRSLYVIGDQGNTPWRSETVGAKLYFYFGGDQKLVIGNYWHNAATGLDAPHSYLSDADGNPVFSGPVYLAGIGNTNLGLYDGEGYGFDPYRNGQESDRVTVDYSGKPTTDLSLKVDASFMDDHYWYIAPVNPYAPGQYSDIPNSRANLNVTLEGRLGQINDLTGGLYFDSSRIDQKEYDMPNWLLTDIPVGAVPTYVAQGKTFSYAAFVQDEIQLGARWTAYAGVREDRWQTDGSDIQRDVDGITPFSGQWATRTSSAFDPKLSLVYRLDDDTTLRASWGRSFRAPTLVDLYVTYASTYGNYYANPALKPEQLQSLEFGGEHEFATRTHVRFAAFASDVTDMVNYASIPDSYNAIVSNTAGVHIRGFEAEATQQVLAHVQALISYTFQKSTVTSNPDDPGSVDKQLVYVPRSTGSAGLKGEAGPYFGSLVASYTSKTYTQSDNADTVSAVYGSFDPYWLVNLQAGYRLTESITAALAVGNLLDRTYYEKVAMPGRTLSLRLTAAF